MMDKFLIQNKKFVISILATYVWGLMAHAYMYFNSAFSVDHLNAYYADSAEEMWKIVGGRFMVPLFRMFRGKIALPWVIGMISLLLLAVVTYLIVLLFQVHSSFVVVLISGFLTTNLTMTTMHATYIHELDIDVFALLFACLGIYMLANYPGIKGIVLSVISLFISMGLYQCYVSVFVTLVIFYGIFMVLFQEKRVKESFIGCLKGLLSFLISFVLYTIIARVICSIVNVEADESRDVLSHLGINMISKVVDVIKMTIKNICLPYSFFNRYLLGLIACSLIISMLVIILKVVFEKKKPKGEMAYILFLLATLPVAVCSVGIISPYMHDAMTYGIWLIFVFCIVVFDQDKACLRDLQEKKKYRSGMIIYVFALILLWNNVVIANECYMKKDIEDKATLSVMTRVVDDLEDCEDYILGQSEIMFIGNGPYYYYMEPYSNIYEICGVDFRGPIYDTNVWFFNDYQAYFDYVMDYPLVTVDSDYYQNHIEEYTSLDIPAFPQEGYIVNINGVFVVNLDCNNERFH